MTTIGPGGDIPPVTPDESTGKGAKAVAEVGAEAIKKVIELVKRNNVNGEHLKQTGYIAPAQPSPETVQKILDGEYGEEIKQMYNDLLKASKEPTKEREITMMPKDPVDENGEHIETTGYIVPTGTLKNNDFKEALRKNPEVVDAILKGMHGEDVKTLVEKILADPPKTE